MGYGEEQIRELEETINATPCGPAVLNMAWWYNGVIGEEEREWESN
jgi:hypothetical protein